MQIIIKAGILLSGFFFWIFFCLTHNQYMPSFISEQMIIQDTASGIVLEQIEMSNLKLIYISDTANTSHEFPRKMSKNYGDLFIFSASQNLNTGRLITFYNTMPWPCEFETALEVDEFPKDLHKKIKSKTLKGGTVLVAHYKGPYEQIGKAYNAINKWMVDNNKAKRDMPFEIYLNDPALVTNKNDLRTDIYQPIQ
jgi:effector-binding domain-containing protein